MYGLLDAHEFMAAAGWAGENDISGHKATFCQIICSKSAKKSTSFAGCRLIFGWNKHYRLAKVWRKCYFYTVETQDQSELKKSIKIWLKANNYSYAWLAERCYVSEATVRNWMAKKLIPAAKVHIIREMVKELPLIMPGRVQVEEETKITLSLDAATRAALEKRAFAQGKTLSEFLADEVPRLGN